MRHLPRFDPKEHMKENDVALTLLHTADWHLGRRFPAFDREQELRLTRARLDVVGRILDLADSRAVDAVLCAGDLFDQPAPDQQWWGGVLKEFQRRDWQRPVVLLPGNHDPLHPGRSTTASTRSELDCQVTCTSSTARAGNCRLARTPLYSRARARPTPVKRT